MKKMVTNLACALLTVLCCGQALADAVPATPYYQGWDADTIVTASQIGGWDPNTSATSISYSSTGGATNGSDGFLWTATKYGTVSGSTLDIGAFVGFPIGGDYSANSWTVSFDWKTIYGSSNNNNTSISNFDGVYLRYRGAVTSNGWLKSMATEYDLTQRTWFSESEIINPLWTDAEANANGWFKDSMLFGGNPDSISSWAATMANVWSTEIRFSGEGVFAAGIDNFSLSAVQDQGPNSNVPEPGTVVLMLSALGALAAVRRRKIG